MLDYDSKFENMMKKIEEQEWLEEIENDEKYLYLEEVNLAEMEPDRREEMEEYIKEKLEQSELFNSKRGKL